jgi:asparagine synthase (glutamine-hydrolysing)
LDHRVVEYAWSLPLSMKIRNGQGKWILKKVLNSYVPKRLVDRPKMGFAVPLASWLRGELKAWAESIVFGSRLDSGGYFDPRVVRRMWREHQSGRWNRQHELWNVLMFESWRNDTTRRSS